MIKGPVNKSLGQFIQKAKKRLASDNEKNLNTDRTYDSYGISIIIATMRENCMENVFNNYKRQDFQNKEMIIVLNSDKMNLDRWLEESKKYENIKVFKLDEKITLGECLNFGVSKSKYGFIAKFDDDDYYGPKYLSDLIRAFEFTDADVVGKASSFVYFARSKILAIQLPEKENRYVKHMDGPTLLIKRSVFDKIKFADIPRGIDTQFSKDCIRNGLKIYSTNKYHHVYIRHGYPNKHTWKISDKDLLKKYCTIFEKDVEDYTKYVDI